MNAAERPCGPRFSPLGTWARVPAQAVQEQLRLAFGHWGLPGRFRVDNGWPWGSHGDFPTELSLWLIGLGLGIHWNNPRSPQEKDYTSSCTSFVFSGEALGNRRGSVLLIPCCLSGLFVPT